jgi:hypothetical protein
MPVLLFVLLQLFVVLLPMLFATSGKGKADAFQGLDLIGRQGRIFRVAFANLVVFAQLDDPAVQVLILFVGRLDVDIAIVGAVELQHIEKEKEKWMLL